METREFLRSLKRLLARKGKPEKIYSDNADKYFRRQVEQLD